MEHAKDCTTVPSTVSASAGDDLKTPVMMTVVVIIIFTTHNGQGGSEDQVDDESRVNRPYVILHEETCLTTCKSL